MCKEQFQDSYYLNRLPPRLDRHIGRTVRRAFAVAAVGLTTFLGGCVQDGLMDMARFQLKPDDIIIERRPDTAYEKFFPYYVELCAASQFRSKLTGEGGGSTGHAILYIKGACRDDKCPVPAIATMPQDRNEAE